MAQRTPYRRLVGGLGASILVHGALVAGWMWAPAAAEEEPEAAPVPFDLVVPDVPPPVAVPDDLPTENTANAVKLPAAPAAPAPTSAPAPKPAEPRAKTDRSAVRDLAQLEERPRFTQLEKSVVEEPAATPTSLATVTLPPDAGVAVGTPETPPPAEPDRQIDQVVAAEGQQAEQAPDQAAVTAGQPPETAQPPAEHALEGVEATAGLDPVLVDLRAFVPTGSRLMIVIRVDRVRNTPWAPSMEAILSPMPDYRAIVAGRNDLKLADAFESIVIATPTPEDVTSTFLAGRTTRDAATLRENLAAANAKPPATKPATAKPTTAKPAATKPPAADPKPAKPRVEWSEVKGVSVGRRTDKWLAEIKDERLFVIPSEGWIVLTRPEHVPHLVSSSANKGGKVPDWITRLSAVEAQTGEGENAPFLVLSAADLDADYLEVPGGGPQLPVPERLTITMSPHPDGVVFSGAAVFGDVETAKTFYEKAEEGRKGALSDFATKFILDRLHCRGGIERLQFRHTKEFVTFSTTLGAKDAAGLFKAAALWSKEYFRTARVKAKAPEPETKPKPAPKAPSSTPSR